MQVHGGDNGGSARSALRSGEYGEQSAGGGEHAGRGHHGGGGDWQLQVFTVRCLRACCSWHASAYARKHLRARLQLWHFSNEICFYIARSPENSETRDENARRARVHSGPRIRANDHAMRGIAKEYVDTLISIALWRASRAMRAHCQGAIGLRAITLMKFTQLYWAELDGAIVIIRTRVPAYL